MKDIIFDDFQNSVDESLLRHKSIIDIITKIQESSARINRAVAKSVTTCGCLQVNANKQTLSLDGNLDTLKNSLRSHLQGKICDNCREKIEEEIGSNLFYLTSLCNILDLNLYDILLKEYNNINTLGKYSLL